jgi:anti-sigma factor RsiW
MSLHDNIIEKVDRYVHDDLTPGVKKRVEAHVETCESCRAAVEDEARQVSLRLVGFKTDADGTAQPRFRLPAWKDGEYALRVTASPSGRPQVITRRVRLSQQAKVMLSSDRPVVVIYNYLDKAQEVVVKLEDAELVRPARSTREAFDSSA